MAFSPKFVCVFFLLISLSFSLQTTYARDSQFFSKVTRNTKDDEFVHLNKQDDQQQQPAFIPQTTETGYGLYGHDTGLNPPTTTTTTTTLYNMDENNDDNNNNNYDENNFNFNNNNNNYDENNFNSNKNSNYANFYKNSNENHEKNYAPELKGLSGTSKYFTNNNNNGNGESKYYGAGYNGGVEKQGMSDTRFLEKGKYFYDVNVEKNFEANNNYMSYSNNNYNNNYNNNGYYGNKENNYDEYYNNNKKNNFYSGNGMQGYQNHVPEEEFDFDQP